MRKISYPGSKRGRPRPSHVVPEPEYDAELEEEEEEEEENEELLSMVNGGGGKGGYDRTPVASFFTCSVRTITIVICVSVVALIVGIAFGVGLALGNHKTTQHLVGDRPSSAPSMQITAQPTLQPIVPATIAPSIVTTQNPTLPPTSLAPTLPPTNTIKPTVQPTAQPVVVAVTPPPTAKPVVVVASSPSPTVPVIITPGKPASDAPVSSLSDPRYGPEQMEFSPERLADIAERKRLAVLHHKRILSLLAIRAPAGNVTATHALFCEEFNARPNTLPYPKYEFPKPSEDPKSPHDRARRVRQYRAALAEYYWYTSHVLDTTVPNPISSPTEASKQNTVKRFASLFLSRLLDKKPLVMGFMGTSVMSGQDNCRYYTLPYQMQRQMQFLFQGTGVEVQVRNIGQNGDGPSADLDVAVSRDVFGEDMQIINTFFAMIPPPAIGLGDWYIKDLARRGVLLANTYSIADIGSKSASVHWDDGWEMASTNAGHVFGTGEFNEIFHWYERHYWGRPDDGRCHMKTREGASWILMQNWHYGPEGFQVLVDEHMLFFARALEMAFEYQAAGKTVKDFNLPPYVDIKAPTYNLASACNMKKEGPPSSNAFWQGRECAGKTGSLRLVAGTGLGPSWTSLSYIGPQGPWELKLGDATNPFPIATTTTAPTPDGVISWSFEQIKFPSRMGGWEAPAEGYAKRPECIDFNDTGFVWRISKPSLPLFGSSQWLTFKAPAHVKDRLAGASKFSVYACTGNRGGAWTFASGVGWSMEFAMYDTKTKARVVDQGVVSLGNATSQVLLGCLEMAKDVPMTQINQPFGFRLNRAKEATQDFYKIGFALHTILFTGYVD